MAANFLKLLKLFFFIQKSNLKTAFQSKNDAFVNVLMMTINNFSFIFMWWIIFENKGSINGWHFSDMALLFAITHTSFAFYAICVRGVEQIPDMIDSGNLDNFLATPQNSLFMIATSESDFANWGDLVSGLLMFFISGYATPANFGIFMFVSALATILLFSFRTILSCLSFFASDIQRLGYNFFMAFLTFGSQPASIFQGAYKIIYLTILPAGFISLYSVEAIKDNSLTALLTVIAATGILFYLAIKMYNHGLKHYASGNRFGVR